MSKPFECSSGTYEGTGAALVVSLGFKPDLLIIFNEEDGDTLGFFIDGMTDDSACVVTAAVALDAADAVTLSATGFALGTGAELNESGKTFKYVAIGGN